MTPKKEGYAGDPTQPTFTPDNISNHSDLITSELHRKARLNGQSMATLYKTNVGSLDAFYRLFGIVETLYPIPLRQAFLDGFFDTVAHYQERGADGTD